MRLLKAAKILIAAAAAVFALSVNSYAGAWLRDSNGWWYCNDDRSYTTDNWQQINGAWYYFDSNGYMVSGWKQVGGSWYYLHADGKMAHDTWIDGTYYVGSDGRMLTNTTTPDGYRVDGSGRWITNAGSNQSVKRKVNSEEEAERIACERLNLIQGEEDEEGFRYYISAWETTWEGRPGYVIYYYWEVPPDHHTSQIGRYFMDAATGEMEFNSRVS